MTTETDRDTSVVEGHGWLLFAAIILAVAGIMRIFDGIWALRNDDNLPEIVQGGTIGDNLAGYGWIWLIVGIVLLLSAFAIMNNSQFARWIGILAGAVMAISAVWWLPYYPVWSLIYIAIGVLVIYGLAMYGGRWDTR